ncbi:hypothetical protein ACIGFK_15790 [Streptomyces sp. NPDC085524]|uniref:hypothetical protein n=1 Tax=unclassified Streptomyces TaxID=2593676 RepID=UPI0035DF4FC3
MEGVLAYTAAGLVGLWGVSHAIPTRAVVAGFGDLVQEWLAEAVTMWSFAALVVVAAVCGGTSTADRTYRVVAGALLVLAVLTALPGARTSVVWFKICPVPLTGSAVLLLIAGLA